MTKPDTSREAVTLKGCVWHYMDAKTVQGYGPWVRHEDYSALLSERDALAAEVERLREAHKVAAVHLLAAASAYRKHASRSRKVGRAISDPFFTTRADDFDKAADEAVAALQEKPHD